MSEQTARIIAKGFAAMDASYAEAQKNVDELISEGYTPEEALTLAGIGGY